MTAIVRLAPRRVAAPMFYVTRPERSADRRRLVRSIRAAPGLIAASRQAG